MNPYDDVPYPSYAFPATSPDRLAVIGALFGLATPSPARARVLELGSSSGGNILGHAATFPDSEVLGLDLSPVQIDLGRRTIADLGLTNARLEVADLATWLPEPGAWDYVICHGVYSWVPRAVQEAILRVCRRALSPHGVAIVSWNANPGWHVQGVARDAMRFLVDPQAPLAARAASAQDALRVLAGVTASDAPTPHVRTLASLAGQMELLPDSYVAHEYLEPDNQPLYLAEVTRDAAAAGLRYLADSHLGDTLPQLQDEPVARALTGLARSRVELEQYLDFLTCRPFRSSLFVRDDAPVCWDLDRADLSGMWAARAEPAEGDGPIDRAMQAIHAAWPGAAPIASLDASRDLTHALLAAFFRGTIHLHRHDRALAGRPGARPRAWPLARRLAQRQHLIVNPWHDTVVLDPLDLLVLTWCDGETTVDTLAERLAPILDAWHRQQPDGPAPQPREELLRRLDHLADRGVLVAEAP